MTAAGPVLPQVHPLTEAQEGLWFAQALDPANPIFNTGQYLDLTGPLDVAVLRAAVHATAQESQSLHLRFAARTAGPVQWLDPAPLHLAEVDLTGHADPETAAHAAMAADSSRPLDLSADPLAAFTLFTLAPDRHWLYERIHHLAIDGYGIALVTNRIAEHYTARVEGRSLAPLPPFQRALDDDADYSTSSRRAGDAAWWRKHLENLPEVTGPNPGRATTARNFHRETCWLDPALLAALDGFAKAHAIQWPDILTALAGAYLARWTGGNAVIGVPFMARMGRKSARVPCTAMNILPLRVTPDEDLPLPQWLATVAHAAAEGRRHGLYRSEQMRRDLGLVGGTRRLFGPLVNVQPYDRPPRMPGLTVALHILSAGAVDDLTLTFRGDLQSGLLFEVDANPDLYTPADVQGHAARLPAFLQAALSAQRLADVPTATPGEVALITPDTTHPVPDTTLTALIAAQFAATPHAPALTYGDTTLTYAELDARTAALAGHLASLGAGPETLVAVALDRSLDLPIALQAILRAGAAYLPLDPDHPPDRLARILTMARPVVTLTSPDLAPLFPGANLLLTPHWPTEGPAPVVPQDPGSMAYVIYTSGSTGEPKGVVIDHRAIVNRLLWMRDHYGFGPDDVILQKTPATFDVSVWEFFLPFLSGARLVIAAPGAHRDPQALADAIRRHAVTTLHFVPSMLSAFLAHPASANLTLRRVFCSGEELTADQRARFHTRLTADLHNLYGPTEAAVDVSHWPATPDDASNPLPIGFPVWNTTLQVLDDRMRPVPPGLAGHLYLGGVQLARGYLGRPDLTAERFIQHNGQRLYATGDLARLRPDGAVVYLGRSDHQVKIRGLRIELGEVESAIMATGLARDCVVIARQDPAGDKRLVAYVVPAPGHAPGLLVKHLSGRLPPYMIPAAEVTLDALPVTANGKLDRKALPAPAFTAQGRPAETAMERRLAGLYARLLHLPADPPAEGDFFALGGNSLLAVRLATLIADEIGQPPRLGAIFEHPSIDRLAATLLAEGAADGLGPMIKLAEGQGAPLFLIHPAGGLAWGYRALARSLSPARPVWGLQHPGLDPTHPLPETLDALARAYVERVQTIAPDGPIHLAGWSVGGLIAQAMAVELAAMGRQVGLVALLDSYPADAWRDEPDPDPAAALRALLAIAGHDPDAHRDLDTRARVVAFLQTGDTPLGALPELVLDGVVRTVTDTNRLVRAHLHRPWAGTLTHIRAALDHAGTALSPAMWDRYATTERLDVPFLHAQMTSPAAAALIGPLLSARMG